MDVTLIAGPPCAGKNTYLSERAAPTDLVVDYDAIAAALHLDATGYDRVDAHKPFICEARDAVLDHLDYGRHHVERAWILNCAASRKVRQQHRDRFGAHVVLIWTPEQVCLQRARTGRPASWQGYVRQWFRDYEPDERDELIPGCPEVGTGTDSRPGHRLASLPADTLPARSRQW